MRPDGMKRVFRMDQLESDIIPSSAHMRHWMINMDYLDNLGVFILDNKKGVEFPAPAHHEEELIWVLEGQLSYNHGPVINPGEAILIVPCLPHPGRFIGKLLVFWCIPFTDSGLSSDAMNKTILPDRVDMNRIIRNPSGSLVTPLAVTNNMSICYIQAQPGLHFIDTTGHPQKEILYVLSGRIEYDDGRVVLANEAICNLPNIPHSAKYGGNEPIRFIEAKSPPDPRFVKFLGV